MKTRTDSRWHRAGNGVLPELGTPICLGWGHVEPADLGVGLFSCSSCNKLPKCRQHQILEPLNSL